MPKAVAWTCSDKTPFIRLDALIGVSMRSACRLVGKLQIATDAYWTYAPSNSQFNLAVCCL